MSSVVGKDGDRKTERPHRDPQARNRDYNILGPEILSSFSFIVLVMCTFELSS